MDATILRDEHVSTNAGFLLEGNDYDDVDAQMGGIDDGQSHTSADGHHDGPPPSHESDSVPPGLNGPNGSVHENDGALEAGNHDIAFPSAPQELNGPHSAVSVDPLEHSLAPDSAVSDAAAEAPVSTPQDAVDSNGSDSTQTQSNATPLQRSDTSDTICAASEARGDDTQLVSTQPVEDTQNVDHLPEATQLVDNEPEQPPSPSTSIATLVLPSVAGSAVQPVDSVPEPPSVKSEPQSASAPSANRLSISYAAATRRLVVDAGVVEKVKVFRQEARIEVHMNIDKDDSGRFRGILVSVVLYPSYEIQTHSLIRRRSKA